MQHNETYFERAPCLYFSTTDDGVIVEVNKQLCAELDFAHDELVGKKVDIIFPIATQIFQQTHFFPLLKMQMHAEEIFISLKSKSNEHVPVLINAKRINENGKNINLYIGIVVYNRKKFEDELIAAKKDAESALRENSALNRAKHDLQNNMEQLDEQRAKVEKHNEELKQFSRVVTHDLQEPLRKLSVFSNLLADEKSDTAKNNLVQKLMHVSTQMRSIISGLQQYVWLTEAPMKVKKVDLNKLLLVVLEQIKKQFSDINIKSEIQTLQEIEADWEQMEVLFYQLFLNAINFRKPGNEATIKITGSDLLLNKFKNIKGKYEYVDFVKIQIIDEGIGMKAQYKEQAFQLFKRLHNNSGRGVGLSLCKVIIENHKGNITLDNHADGGAVVTIFLPIHPKEIDSINRGEILKQDDYDRQ